MNEFIAKHRRANISAQKARLVANLIRGALVSDAQNTLKFVQKKAARLIETVLNSAIANAEHNGGVDRDELKVKMIFVTEGPSLRRFSARAKGRGNRIEKQSCHINVALSVLEK